MDLLAVDSRSELVCGCDVNDRLSQSKVRPPTAPNKSSSVLQARGGKRKTYKGEVRKTSRRSCFKLA